MTANSEARPTLAPTPKQIDALIAEYAEAQSDALAAKAAAGVMQEKADHLKAGLVAMVEAHGQKYTEKSKRLEGIHNKATTTTATRVVTKPASVDEFRASLEIEELPDLMPKFFTTHVSYSLVNGPGEVMKTLSLPARLRAKLERLLGRCFEITTSAPSLKIEVPELEAARKTA